MEIFLDRSLAATKPKAEGGNKLDFLSRPKNIVRQVVQKVASKGSDKHKTERRDSSNWGVIASLAVIYFLIEFLFTSPRSAI